MSPFEQAVLAEVKRVREMLAHTELITNFEFRVEASGRAMDGDVMIKFVVECNYGRAVEANSVEGAVYEALRREGWQRTNEPLCLPRVEELETDITGDRI